MRQEVKHEVYGVIAYEESALSGSKNISINRCINSKYTCCVNMI